jgi:hypothetical protein
MKKPFLKFEYKTFTLESEITQEQKDYFKKYGVIQYKNFISPETALGFIDELAKIESQWLSDGVQKINGIPLKFGKNPEGEDMIQRMCFTNKHSEILQEFLKWNRANPQYNSEKAAKTLVRFFAQSYPCKQ